MGVPGRDAHESFTGIPFIAKFGASATFLAHGVNRFQKLLRISNIRKAYPILLMRNAYKATSSPGYYPCLVDI